ncbi:peptidase C45 [Microbacterium trichothecenolyticum]|uniref:C45 family autoproteolytic acyltransferase/hydolase n=1 Tax=Microbacterium trichothecenolyticum TaxID=69370 RepID=UPI001C6E8114|nr:C45 family peptidase [Microbacterium trichothecenolyticum]MBW9120387.1 peptidase C45 [Microbacterium trichothecenolyticum]
MELRTFTSTTPDAVARGRELGAAFGPQYRRTAELYLAHFAELGIPADDVRALAERTHASLQAWAPDLAAEAEAIAVRAELELWRLAAVGGRTEILAVAPRPRAGECSTAVHVGPGLAAETLQTWDWHEFLVPEGLLLELTALNGLRVKMFTEFGTPGKIGVNSAGVGLHFNILSHRTDSAAGGVPVHAVARRVLEEARSIEEAESIAASATVSASTVLTVFETTPTGSRAAAFELAPAGLGIVEPGADGWLFHTNHFLDPALSAGDTMEDATTVARLAHLDHVRGELVGLASTDRALAACGGRGSAAEICMIPDLTLSPLDQWTTLLTVAVDTEGFALEVFPGRPDEAAAAGLTRF